MTNTDPTTLYVGKREAVIAEYGGLSHIYSGKYLLAFDGEGSFPAEGVDTLKDAKGLVAEYKRAYPGIRVCWL
jgi:hypothetical protein